MLNSAVGTSDATLKQDGAALTEQIGVAQFVDRVLEIEPAQKRIRSDFRGAQDVAAAIAFDLGKGEELAHPSIGIAPHPPMNRPQQPVDAGSLAKRHRDSTPVRQLNLARHRWRSASKRPAP